MQKTTIKERLAAEKQVEPVEVDRDNGTQTFSDSKTEKVTAPVVIEGAAVMDNVDLSVTPQVSVDYIETPVVVREKRVIDERISAENMAEIIESYKTSNPKKYEAKKAELEKKMAAVKTDAKAKAKSAKAVDEEAE